MINLLSTFKSSKGLKGVSTAATIIGTATTVVLALIEPSIKEQELNAAVDKKIKEILAK